MTPTPHTIGSDQTLAHAHDVMRAHGVRHLPVLRGGKLVGVLSQRDLYFVESSTLATRTVDEVAEAMTQDVYTVGPREHIGAVVKQMAEHKFGCAVVVERGHVVGIFTATDALGLLAKILDGATASASSH